MLGIDVIDDTCKIEITVSKDCPTKNGSSHIHIYTASSPSTNNLHRVQKVFQLRHLHSIHFALHDHDITFEYLYLFYYDKLVLIYIYRYCYFTFILCDKCDDAGCWCAMCVPLSVNQIVSAPVLVLNEVNKQRSMTLFCEWMNPIRK